MNLDICYCPSEFSFATLSIFTSVIFVHSTIITQVKSMQMIDSSLTIFFGGIQMLKYTDRHEEFTEEQKTSIICL